MALLLNIDTAGEQAGVCLSLNETVVACEQSSAQKNHASFIQPAIKNVVQTAGYAIAAIDAVAVTGGPGSYTGLRVGLATAKGLCYALGKPLIMVNTLEVMALAAIQEQGLLAEQNQDVLFCPMIDARRLEVFAGLYTAELEAKMPASAIILDENSFGDVLDEKRVVFSGIGSEKAKIIHHPNAIFSNVQYSVKQLSVLALMAYKASNFVTLAYSEPLYIKDFYKKP